MEKEKPPSTKWMPIGKAIEKIELGDVLVLEIGTGHIRKARIGDYDPSTKFSKKTSRKISLRSPHQRYPK